MVRVHGKGLGSLGRSSALEVNWGFRVHTKALGALEGRAHLKFGCTLCRVQTNVSSSFANERLKFVCIEMVPLHWQGSSSLGRSLPPQEHLRVRVHLMASRALEGRAHLKFGCTFRRVQTNVSECKRTSEVRLHPKWFGCTGRDWVHLDGLRPSK